MEQQPLVKIRDLTVSYKTRARIVRAVTNFNLTIYPGEKIGLAGESGCGKSTMAFGLMNYLSRAGFIENGTMEFEGKSIPDFTESETRQFRGKDAAMVYQDPLTALNPSMRIKDQLIEVPLNHEEGVTKDEALKMAEDILDKVRLPDKKRILNSYPHQLSGGQQQRIVIALALMAKPKLLILDEPTTALDVTVEAGIMRLIDDIADEFGTAILLISHNIGLIYRTCDKVGVMYSGKMVEFAETDRIINNPMHPYTKSLFNCIPRPDSHKYDNPLIAVEGQPPVPWERPPGCVFSDRCPYSREECTSGEVPKQMAADEHFYLCFGYDPNAVKPPEPRKVTDTGGEAGKVVMEISDLVRHYKYKKNPLAFGKSAGDTSVKALNGFNAKIQKDHILCVVGESGCGKSTMAKVLAGLEKANSGKIIYDDDNIASKNSRERAKETLRKIQMIFQNPNDTLNPKIPIGKQVARNLVKLTDIKDKKEIDEKVREILSRVRLPEEYFNYRPNRLSGGQKQRVAISRAFISTPEVIVADEPVSALDVSVQAAVMELMLEMKEEFRGSIIFISHDIALVKYLADEVIVMYMGHIMEQGPAEKVFSAPYHPYTEALFSAVPRINRNKMKDTRILGEGELPSPTNPPKGCPFHTRCHFKLGDICENTPPPLIETDCGHCIRCHVEPADLKLKQDEKSLAV